LRSEVKVDGTEIYIDDRELGREMNRGEDKERGQRSKVKVALKIGGGTR